MTHEIFHVEDSFTALRELVDSCDVVLTDPPYNDHVQSNQISGTAMKAFVTDAKREGSITNRKYTKGSGAIPHVVMPFAPLTGYEFAGDLVRAARRWAISFCAVEDFGEFRRAVGKAYVRGGIWYKPNAQGQMTGDRPAACYEGLAIMHREGKKVWNGRGSYGLWVCNGTRGEKGRHPNQKPLDLCLKLVALFTNRGDTVLDPFCGSGRIGEACVLLGRNYIGLDNDESWVERARERLAAQGLAGCTDAFALTLCTARKQEVLDTDPEELR